MLERHRDGLPPFSLTDLRYLVTLEAERGFSRAAERCAVSQPTLSLAIQRIEAELGVRLFERTRGLVGPTQVGRRSRRRRASSCVKPKRSANWRKRDAISSAAPCGSASSIRSARICCRRSSSD